MNTENMGELYAAMAAARLEFGALTKTKSANIKSDKGSYSYSYADLSDVIEATAQALARHGLVIIQEPEVVNDGNRAMVIIYGCIAHKSGGVRELRPLPMPVAGTGAQAVGSAIAYGRRYQLTAALNLAADDDDGKSATGDESKPRQSHAPKLPSQQKAEAVQHRTPAEDGSNPFESDSPPSQPTDAELEILGAWRTPQDAQDWAVQVTACANIHEARESFKKIVDAHGGKLTKQNVGTVYLEFLRHQDEKLVARQQQSAPSGRPSKQAA